MSRLIPVVPARRAVVLLVPALAALLALALATALATPLAAQGPTRIRSPYRDILKGKSITLFYSDLGGDGGRIGVGPQNGPMYGIRADIRLGTPLQFGLSLARSETKRFVVSADDSVHLRKTGPVDEPLTFIEGALQLNLTGKKSWNRLAPFIGGAAGFAIADKRPAGVRDSSDYKFGTKFYIAPSIGTRVMLGQSFSLRLEVRQLFWKLQYPFSYLDEPEAEPSIDPENPNAVIPDGKREEWSGARELRIGAAFHF
jgi:hypothetical protein